MMENETIQENWFKRNRFWIFILSGIIFFGIVVISVSWNFSDFAKSAIDTELCDDAIVTANGNSKVIERLGVIEPVSQMAIFEGNSAYSNNDNHVEITVRVKGEKGHAKMDVVADKLDGNWNYKSIRIRTKNPADTIDVVN